MTEERKTRIVAEKGERGRKILVYGFCNIIKDNILESACCVDCYQGFHGPDAIERLELQSGDEIIAAQANNHILFHTENGMSVSVNDSLKIRNIKKG